MPIESPVATTIAGLNPLWPLHTDNVSDMDTHLREIKATLKTDALSLSAGGAVAGAVTHTGPITVTGSAGFTGGVDFACPVTMTGALTVNQIGLPSPGSLSIIGGGLTAAGPLNGTSIEQQGVVLIPAGTTVAWPSANAVPAGWTASAVTPPATGLIWIQKV